MNQFFQRGQVAGVIFGGHEVFNGFRLPPAPGRLEAPPGILVQGSGNGRRQVLCRGPEERRREVAWLQLRVAGARAEINVRLTSSSWSAVAPHRFGSLGSMDRRNPKRCRATALQDLKLISRRSHASLVEAR